MCMHISPLLQISIPFRSPQITVSDLSSHCQQKASTLTLDYQFCPGLKNQLSCLINIAQSPIPFMQASKENRSHLPPCCISGLEKWQALLVRKTSFPVGEGGGRGSGAGGEREEGFSRRRGSPGASFSPFPPLHPNSTHMRSCMRFCLFSRDV